MPEKKPGRIRHWWLGCWPRGAVGFDGVSMTAVCAYCDYRILQDSYGQWFSAGPIHQNRSL